MNDDGNGTTNTDAGILADFRRLCEAVFRGVGIDPAAGVAPGGEPGASRVRVFEMPIRRPPASKARCRSRCGEMTP